MKTSSGVGRTEPWFRLSTQIWQGGWADGGRTYFSNHTVCVLSRPWGEGTYHTNSLPKPQKILARLSTN